MPTPRDTLVCACDRVGVRHPKPRQHRTTWLRRAIGPHRAAELDPMWLERARLYLEAGWAATAVEAVGGHAEVRASTVANR